MVKYDPNKNQPLNLTSRNVPGYNSVLLAQIKPDTMLCLQLARVTKVLVTVKAGWWTKLNRSKHK